MTSTSWNWRGLLVRRILPIVAISVAVVLVSAAAVAFTGFGGLTAIWPTNALILLAVLRGPRERLWAPGVCAGAFVAMVLPITLAGAPLIGALLICLTNMVEIGVALWLLGVFSLIGKDLTRPGALFGFLVCAALIAPAAGAGAAALLAADIVGGTPAQTWWDYWAADALGVMILAPFGMVLTHEHLSRLARPRDMLTAAALLAAIGAGCWLVRSDASQLALLTPLAVLATLRFGPLGAAGAVLWAGVVAIGLNLAGLGGVAAGSPDLRAELFDLQVGLAILPLAVLPVAAVLAQRDRATRAARAADRAKSEFLANMSHEIRTPLNGVVGMAGLLAQSAGAPREREIAGVIHASGLTLERLLSDVLDLARMEAGGLDLRAEPFDLAAVAGLVFDTAVEQAAARGLKVELEIADDVGCRLGDPARVRQVLSALLSNAVKFTDAGHVRLTVRTDGEGVVLSVADTGCGFDPARKAEMFGRFQQADGSITRRHDGAGMGLAIARHVVEAMGGTLDADSVPGEGSTFTAVLPLPVAETAPVAALAEAVAAEPSEDRPLRILLADDHPTNRKVVELILASAEVELVSVENGALAVEAFRSQPFDLVLMDMQMPVMDGLTAVRAIRAHEAAEGLQRGPILMLTANALPEHAEASFAAGADRHLTKPITAPALFAAIEDALTPSKEVLAA